MVAKTESAVLDGKALWPDEPIDLEPGAVVKITISGFVLVFIRSLPPAQKRREPRSRAASTSEAKARCVRSR